MAGVTTTPNRTTQPYEPPRERVPPLENGDRLTRAEFERRYKAMPRVKKAELIEGVVYMPSPVSLKHSQPHADILTWLGTFRAATPGTIVGDNGTVRLDLDNEPQPDAMLFVSPEFGGQARIDADGYVDGAPELVVEVSTTTASIDLYAKKNAYRRNGVKEYIVWRVLDNELDWFVLRNEEYERLTLDSCGILKSDFFPGLWLDSASLLRGDLASVLARLKSGIESSEHAAFKARLQENKSKA